MDLRLILVCLENLSKLIDSLDIKVFGSHMTDGKIPNQHMNKGKNEIIKQRFGSFFHF
jgi:hypothetical protein